MQLSRSARIALRVAAGCGFAAIYVPLALVLVNSFNSDRSASWPPSGLTLHWWSVAWENEGARAALWVSVKAGLGATAIALLLGTLIAFAVPGTVLRPRRHLLRGRPADRAARHRHGHRAQLGVPYGPGAARASASACSPWSSATPPSASSSSSTTSWPGCAAPPARTRRRPWTWARTPSSTFRRRHLPAGALGAARGRAARLRALLRRDRGDDVHGRPRHRDPADLDLQEPDPSPAGAGRERRGGGPGPALRAPDLRGPAAVRGHGDREPDLGRVSAPVGRPEGAAPLAAYVVCDIVLA